MGEYSELKKACMAFQLKDGNIIWISQEDCHEIAMKIIVEGSLQKNTVILRERDLNIEKAQQLFKILTTEKDLPQNVRNRYLTIIGNLLGSENIITEDLESCGPTKVGEV